MRPNGRASTKKNGAKGVFARARAISSKKRNPVFKLLELGYLVPSMSVDRVKAPTSSTYGMRGEQGN